jgi:tRNA threonylcarbamoyladenosine biosynthesis protein TsaE
MVSLVDTQLRLHLPDEVATRALGAKLAKVVGPGLSIHLSGDLGSGKTTLARGLIHALGFPGKVKSPSYTLVEPYIDSRLSLYHFDFFRFRDPEEWADAGFRECFNEDSICVVEWPEKAAELLPPPDLRVVLSAPAGGGRDASIDAGTEPGHRCLNALAALLSAA